MDAATHPTVPVPEPAAPNARHLDLLAELTELGMELAREVAALLKSRLVEARESGWDGNLPKDPAAPFARIALAVRRTIALEVALRERVAARVKVAGALFAPPDRGIDLNPKFALWEDAAPPAYPDDGVGEAAETPERPLSVGAIVTDDLGRLLDDRERFFDVPNAPHKVLIAGLCRDLGLDPARLAWRGENWVVRADPKDAASTVETPLRSWRPALAALFADVPGAASPPDPAPLE